MESADARSPVRCRRFARLRSSPPPAAIGHLRRLAAPGVDPCPALPAILLRSCEDGPGVLAPFCLAVHGAAMLACPGRSCQHSLPTFIAFMRGQPCKSKGTSEPSGSGFWDVLLRFPPPMTLVTLAAARCDLPRHAEGGAVRLEGKIPGRSWSSTARTEPSTRMNKCTHGGRCVDARRTLPRLQHQHIHVDCGKQDSWPGPRPTEDLSRNG